ncbi:phosphatidylethanolamine-binding protein [Mycena sp. CBHHK59/15]|nr:phosphatidylethanolamine-binding protein [Mycena sp. CBHHK59/15]
MISLTVVSLALLSLSNAATTLLDIENNEAHFTNAFLVPALLPTFTPSALLSLVFVSSVIEGQALAKADVAAAPTVSVHSFNATLDGNFTIAMVDADVVGTDESGGVNRHWLLNSVTVSGSDNTVSNSSATPITEYAGPGPASGSGPHRYVVLLYHQPSTFSPPAGLSQTVPGVSKFDLNAYVKDSGLGDLVAATYFTVEVGTATTSLPITSAVDTSTLPSAPSGSATASKASASASTTSKPNAGLGLRFESATFIVVAAAIAAVLV